MSFWFSSFSTFYKENGAEKTALRHLNQTRTIFKPLAKIIYCRFWGLKYLIVIGGIIGAFFIPEGTFGITWMWFGIIGGFLFILIQLILIIDFAHSWAEAWVGNYEETESKGWYYALIGVTLLCYAISIAGVVLLYVFFTTVWY